MQLVSTSISIVEYALNCKRENGFVMVSTTPSTEYAHSVTALHTHLHSNIRPVLFANGIWRPELERYTSLVQQIKEKARERTALIREKKELPFLRIICSRELLLDLQS